MYEKWQMVARLNDLSLVWVDKWGRRAIYRGEECLHIGSKTYIEGVWKKYCSGKLKPKPPGTLYALTVQIAVNFRKQLLSECLNALQSLTPMEAAFVALLVYRELNDLKWMRFLAKHHGEPIEEPQES